MQKLRAGRKYLLFLVPAFAVVALIRARADDSGKTGKFCPELSFFEASKQKCYRGKLKSAHDYTQALFKVMPWYPKEEVKPIDKKYTGCGCREYFVRQQRVGSRFQRAQMATGFMGTGRLTLAKPCKFKRGNKLKAAYATVKGYLRGLQPERRFKPGDKLVSPDGWNLERHKISGRVISRWGIVLHCSKRHTYKATHCGGADDTLACELSGSKTAKAINVISWRLKQGKEYQGAGNKTGCAVTSWAAASTACFVKRMYAEGTKSGSWRKGLRYKTRYNGVHDDKSAFELIDKLEAEAIALYKSCGGDPSMLPTEARYCKLRSAY